MCYLTTLSNGPESLGSITRPFLQLIDRGRKKKEKEKKVSLCKSGWQSFTICYMRFFFF